MVFDRLNSSTLSRTEFFYQQRAHQPRKRWWIAPAFYGLLIGLGLFSAFLGLKIFAGDRDFFVAQPIVSFYYVVVLHLHFGFMLRTLYLSTAAMIRDKMNTQRWEALVLTGVSGREIVLSKWWTTVRAFWRQYLLLGLLRTVVIFTLMTAALGRSPYAYSTFDMAHVQPTTLLLAGSFMITLSLMSLFYTAAGGVMSALLTRNGGNIVRAFLVRTVVCLITGLLPIVVWYCVGVWHIVEDRQFITFPDHAEAGRLIFQFTSVIVDNGISYGSQYIINGFWAQKYPLLFPILFVLTTVTYGVMTWALLWIAQWRAQHFGALSPREAKRVVR
jgi:hypothetical protein